MRSLTLAGGNGQRTAVTVLMSTAEFLILIQLVRQRETPRPFTNAKMRLSRFWRVSHVLFQEGNDTQGVVSKLAGEQFLSVLRCGIVREGIPGRYGIQEGFF